MHLLVRWCRTKSCATPVTANYLGIRTKQFTIQWFNTINHKAQHLLRCSINGVGGGLSLSNGRNIKGTGFSFGAHFNNNPNRLCPKFKNKINEKGKKLKKKQETAMKWAAASLTFPSCESQY